MEGKIEIIGGPHDGKIVEGWVDMVWLGHVAQDKIYQCCYFVEGEKALYSHCIYAGKVGEFMV